MQDLNYDYVIFFVIADMVRNCR